jgi:NAD(P)-dependent dehydrogenase (short-subunit alcohol dehydrogenase family)
VEAREIHHSDIETSTINTNNSSIPIPGFSTNKQKPAAPSIMADQRKYTSKLEKSRILIIGGSSGLGFGVAEASLENGALVTISSSNQTRINNAIEKLQKSYPSAKDRIFGVPVDLANPDTTEQELERLFNATVEKMGGEKLDHVIYTAGDALATMSISDMSMQRILKAGQIRFFAPLLAAKFIQTHVKQTYKSSYTVTTGSVSEKPIPGWSVTGSFAGGHHSMVRALALDLKPVRICGVSPGAVDTELWSSMPEEERNSLMDTLGKKLPTGRVGQVEDVVEAFLAIMKDANITASMVRTDGGGLIM